MVTDDLLISLIAHTQSVISCFQMLCDYFIFFFRNFYFDPSELNYS